MPLDSANCQWCGGRGCVYCPPAKNTDERIAAALEHLARHGLVNVHVVLTPEEFDERLQEERPMPVKPALPTE